MRRSLSAVGAGLVLALAMAGPAFANHQSDNYGQQIPHADEGSGQPSEPDPNADPDDGGSPVVEAPPPARQEATVSNPTPAPGETIRLTAPPVNSQTPLDPEAPYRSGIARGSVDGQAVALEPTLVVNPDGSVTVSVTIPEGTPTGLYYVFVVGKDAAGNDRVLVALITVKAPEVAAAAAGASMQTLSGAPIAVPAKVRRLQAQLNPAEEAALTAQVLEGDAEVAIDGELLVVSRPQGLGLDADSDNATRPLVAALVVGIVGGSLVMVRRPSNRQAVAR